MNTPQKSLETKITNILTNPSCRDFILVDAKDADMAFGLAAPGILSEPFAEDQTFRTMEFYREQILGIVEDGNIDIMLMSASTNAQLTIDWKIFKSSSVTPAVRMNDTTDIWLSAGTGSYSTQPPLPFSTCTIKEAQYGRNPTENITDATSSDAVPGSNLGLFSLTLNDRANIDRPMLDAYKNFRLDAELKISSTFLKFFIQTARRVVGRSQISIVSLRTKLSAVSQASHKKTDLSFSRFLTCDLLLWNNWQTMTKVLLLEFWEAVQEQHAMHSRWLRMPKNMVLVLLFLAEK